MQEGQLTQTVYGLLRDESYGEAVELLRLELQVVWACALVRRRRLPAARRRAADAQPPSNTHTRPHAVCPRRARAAVAAGLLLLSHRPV